MAAVRRLYLDTNVFIALEEGTGELTNLLIDLIAGVPVTGERFLATSELTLAELLPRPYAEGRDDLIDRYDSWILPNSWLDVAPVTRDVLWGAGVLRAQHPAVMLPDAIHLSAAFGLQCTHFLRGDLRLKGTMELPQVKDGQERPPLSLDVVHLEMDTVAAIVKGLGER